MFNPSVPLKQISDEEYLKAVETVKIYHLNTNLQLAENTNHDDVSMYIETTSTHLWHTDLSKRAVNVCKIHDYTQKKAIEAGTLQSEDFKPLATIADLCDWTENELLELQNCGKKTITDFEQLLGKYGLILKT